MCSDVASKPAPMFDDRERVLEATDIVALIGDHLTLRAKGREFVGLCPFHDDPKPSMGVVPQKQIFHCFSCGAGGNAFDFMMRYHGMTFVEALKQLAERANIELTPRRRAAQVDQAEPGVTRDDLAAANRFALDFFRTILGHQQHGEVARTLIDQRGIAPAMAEMFQLGAAPDRWDGLVKTIESRGLAMEPFIAAGLVKRRESGGGFYDAMRHRLIFPILDQMGRPIAFGGRKIRDEDEPKYLNSPETALFKKGSTLFALPQAFRAIQSTRTAVITEGYTDAIACHQAGVANVVATLGTALTLSHASVLRRCCDTVVLLFDGDEAGLRAADRALEVLLREALDVRVAVLPDELDPDEMLKQDGGADRFRAVLAHGADLLEYRYARMDERLKASGSGVGSQARARAIEEEIARLAELGLAELPPIRRQTIVRKLARLGGVDEQTILRSLPRRGAARGATTVVAPPDRSPDRGSDYVRASRPVSAREHAVACLLADPLLSEDFLEQTRDVLNPAAYSSDPLGVVAGVLRDAMQAGTLGTSLIHSIDDARARQTAIGFVAEVGRITEGKRERLVDHWQECLKRIGQEARGDQPADQGRGTVESLEQKLERTREKHARLGGNPLAMPRPS